MLEVKNLYCNINKKKVLKYLSDVSFTVPDGYMVCLLGKSSCEITALLKIIYGIIIPSSGSVYYNEKEIIKKDRFSSHVRRITEFRKDAALITDDSWCEILMSVDENLSFLSSLYDNFDHDEFERIISSFEFAVSDRNKMYYKLSTGQQMQFQIAFNLARHPKLLLMDEPFANLDPIIKEDILELIRNKIASENISVIMSTQLVEEISDIVDYIGIIENQKMKAFGSRDELFDKFGVQNIRELMKGDQ